MILTSQSLTIIPDEILDNKVLIYSVYIEKDHVITEGQLVTIREMLDSPEFRKSPPQTMIDLARRYFVFERGGYSEETNACEFAEALFDQETALERWDHLNDRGLMGDDTTEKHLCDLSMSIIFSMFKGLPESVDYAV